MSERTAPAPLLQVSDVGVDFRIPGKGRVHAVDGASLRINPGQTVGLVGESGCGKSTLGRAIARLEKTSRGSITFMGQEVTTLRSAELRSLRSRLQIVFQDPFASLDPRMTIGDAIGEALHVHRKASTRAGLEAQVRALLDSVGLPEYAAHRFPHEFSGGQRQRVGIARALAVEPDLVILDEPISALDVSVQAQIVNLLEDLQEERGLAYLFIAHDLAVVRHISDYVAVMYLGRIVEEGPADAVYATPRHPYTKALLSAVPSPDPAKERTRERIVLTGEVPSPLSPPSGCRFRTRCWKATDLCATADPPLRALADSHLVACHFPV